MQKQDQSWIFWLNYIQGANSNTKISIIATFTFLASKSPET